MSRLDRLDPGFLAAMQADADRRRLRDPQQQVREAPRTETANPPKGATLSAAKARWRLFNDFVDVHQRHLKPTARSVWLTLFRDTKQSGLARTSEADLAARTGRSERAISLAVAELVKAGRLEVAHQGGTGGRGISVYKVL